MRRVIHWLYKFFGSKQYKQFWKGKKWTYSNGDYGNGND